MSSIEVRWFASGPLPASVVDVFRDAALIDGATPPVGAADAGSAREDVYLVLTARPDIGLKVRREQGAAPRLEFKGRTGTTAPLGVGDSALRPLERWTRWSVTEAEVPSALRARLLDPEDTSATVTVIKRRRLRLVELDYDGPVRELADPLTRVDRGVMVELTDLEVGGARSWTLGLEAFPGHTGPESDAANDMASDVAAIARRLLAGIGGLPPGARCCGYAEWLADVVGDRRG